MEPVDTLHHLPEHLLGYGYLYPDRVLQKSEGRVGVAAQAVPAGARHRGANIGGMGKPWTPESNLVAGQEEASSTPRWYFLPRILGLPSRTPGAVYVDNACNRRREGRCPSRLRDRCAGKGKSLAGLHAWSRQLF